MYKRRAGFRYGGQPFLSSSHYCPDIKFQILATLNANICAYPILSINHKKFRYTLFVFILFVCLSYVQFLANMDYFHLFSLIRETTCFLSIIASSYIQQRLYLFFFSLSSFLNTHLGCFFTSTLNLNILSSSTSKRLSAPSSTLLFTRS